MKKQVIYWKTSNFILNFFFEGWKFRLYTYVKTKDVTYLRAWHLREEYVIANSLIKEWEQIAHKEKEGVKWSNNHLLLW